MTPLPCLCAHSDLEKSVEKIQKDLAHNHRLIPVQELEEKAVVLKQLGETLTDLKGEDVAGSGAGWQVEPARISLLHPHVGGLLQVAPGFARSHLPVCSPASPGQVPLGACQRCVSPAGFGLL